MPPRRRRNRTTEEVAIASLSYPAAHSLNNPTAEHWAQTTGDAAQTIAEPTTPDDEQPPRLRAPRLDWNHRDAIRPSPRHGPLHTHDKVSPKAILAGLMNTRKQGTLFDHDFNGYADADGNKHDQTELRFQPYRYAGHWHNRLIRATAQRAMLSLLHREQMRGQVNLIYIDPPYNNSFRSNFAPQADDLETDENAGGIPNDPIAIQAFRDTYEFGIDSYLNGLREQLELARELLTESGSCILQIGPDNLHYVAVLMSEVFGHENHVATIPYTIATNSSTKMVPEIGNWLLWYAKSKPDCKYRQVYEDMDLKSKIALMNTRASVVLPSGTARRATIQEKENPAGMPKGTRWFQTTTLASSHESSTDRSDAWHYDPLDYSNRPAHYPAHANAYPCPTGRQWSVSPAGLHSIAASGRMFFQDNGNVEFIRFAEEMPGRTITSIWINIGAPMDKQYIVETPPRVLDRCVLMTTDPGDLVLDLTCGSGAMPIACERWGRRWIAVDVSAVSIAIARDRIISTTHPAHLLKDTPEGHRKDWELEQVLLPPDQRTARYEPTRFPENHIPDPAVGFVNERQLRVSAATLAYGPNPDSSDIIRHPDRTLKAAGKVRVSSDFDVCSDSPYRAVSPNELLAETASQQTTDIVADLIRDTGFQADLVTERIRRNLQTSGIGENGRIRYRVENLQPAVYEDITHTGTLIDPDGHRHTAAFYIGHADEIIAPNRVDRAASDATHDPKCTHLVIVGFAQDADAIGAGRSYEKRFTLLYVNAHRDLQLPDLKDEARNNAFTIISEPEVRITPAERPDEYRLEVTGVCAFNSAEGYAFGHRQSDIIALMVDTAYDGERFLPTRYNIMPCKRNRKTLRDLYAAFKGRITDANWQQMQSLATVPFRFTTDPETGRTMPIAVKVIDQTGTEHKTVIHRPETLPG